jgi:triosephosphate isomerase
MRTPLMAGNWKMNKTISEAEAMVKALKPLIADVKDVEVLICPVFTSLYSVSREIKDSNIKLGAQNLFWEAKGAFTGEISPSMVKDAGCSYAIIGHSERRQYFGETDGMINKKAKAILAGGLIPIICCGETLEQREAGVTDSHIAEQIKAALEGLSEEQVSGSVIAYEPIWAIGTGKTCDADEANRVIAMIRGVVKEISSQSAADAVRILYGGSVNPASISEQMSKSDIDGALVGGASLKADSFNEIIANTMKIAV